MTRPLIMCVGFLALFLVAIALIALMLAFEARAQTPTPGERASAPLAAELRQTPRVVRDRSAGSQGAAASGRSQLPCG